MAALTDLAIEHGAIVLTSNGSGRITHLVLLTEEVELFSEITTTGNGRNQLARFPVAASEATRDNSGAGLSITVEGQSNEGHSTAFAGTGNFVAAIDSANSRLYAVSNQLTDPVTVTAASNETINLGELVINFTGDVDS